MAETAEPIPATTIIGIDLGTTNSLVALTERGVPVVLPDEHGHTLLASVVYFPVDGSAPVVGEAAKKHLSFEPERTVYSAKRLMGKGAADVAAERTTLSYALSDDARFAESVRIDLGAGGGRSCRRPKSRP
jgi:molecular chaperone DnaK (HSP70)